MDTQGFNELRTKVRGVGNFIKFGRKRILLDVCDSLSELETDINNIDNLQKEVVEKNYELKSVAESYNCLEKDFTKTTSNLKSLTVSYENEKVDHAQTKFQFSEVRLLNDALSVKYGLISDLLATSGVDNPHFEKFQRLIKTDFIDFANCVSSLAEEAQAILQLQSIEKRIEMLLNFSDIYNKKIIAIGGGFSAGKSEFISSFFKDDEISLPIGINPVTAIPTYITSGIKNSIRGYAKKGGNINIEPSLYKELSHDFIKSFSFNLKEIMPVMAISTALDYENICFVDTPGYDPAASNDSFASEDVDTAKEHLQQANVLLWLVGLDSNGTIPGTDIKFLENISLENKKLYVVANKADVKSEDEIEDILDNFIETLDDADIEYEGVCAFNSLDTDEVFYRKLSIFDFLANENQKVEIQAELLKDLTHVFRLYENALEADIKLTKEISLKFKSLELDILQTLSGDYDDKVGNRINTMKKYFTTTELQKHLNNLKKVESKIITEFHAIWNFLDNLL